MRPERRTGWLGLVAAAVLVTSCTSAPEGSANFIEGSEGGRLTAVENNRQLARQLAYENIVSKRENDRLVVQFDLVNKRSSRLEFAWTIDWYDANEFHIDDATRRWEPISLGGHASQTLKVTAHRPEATSFKLQFTSRNEVK